ncbi:hypothetical protein POJ06DRAFT_271950 [Lipomyces tetrasporus]|uniref:Uncharacterized protein n=1 Tax=Lipomyces tetrasporus TaxID=54092 RepID=A0AAD7QKI2_9ASCO|nr:uncharacterized protein POJ06DRAFT_271950 [Lipomyces tetrasporus]KAJ8096934.1 hypothetical protein POJ06DRAFT_271950 [Lipomyces tetrasporus]
MVRASLEQKSYQHALDFLIENEPERRFDTRLTYESFLALQGQARTRYGDECFPRVEYSSRGSTVTIHTVHSALHAKAAEVVQQWLDEALRAELVSHDMREVGDRFSTARGRTMTTGNDLKVSVKNPDGGLVYHKSGQETMTVAIVVGVSQAYQPLKDDIMTWLHEFHCRTGVLFSLKEKPGFKYPMNEYSAADIGPFQNAISRARLDQPFGPYVYNQHQWFGSLDHAFVEIYRRDTNGGLKSRQRFNVIKDGKLVLPGDSVNLTLTVKDMFPYDEEDIDVIQLLPMFFRNNFLQEFLEDGVAGAARWRFNDAIGNRRN